MKIIAVMQVDLETTPLGTRSRLAAEIGGTTVLRRTVEAAARARRVDEVVVLCPSQQFDRCARLLEGARAMVVRLDAPAPPWAALVRIGRKWSLDGWRGGIGGTTCFDEFVRPDVLSGLLRQRPADALLVVPPAAPLLDATLADRMIEHWTPLAGETRVVFMQTPPGVTGVVLEASLVHDLGSKNVPLGWTFSYKPQAPRKDLIFEPACLAAPAALRHATGRLIADTQRSFERVAALLRDHPAPDAEAVGKWLLSREQAHVEPLPREVEIELTTDDPYPDALLRPRGSRVEPRGPIAVAVVEQIAAAVARYDDALLVLGGCGEPLRHPRLADVLAAIRRAMPRERESYGLAVRTAGVDLDDERTELLIDHGVDVLNVVLDAWTPELYARLNAPDDPSSASLEAVLGKLDRLTQRCRQLGTSAPVILAEMTKARDSVHELDAFFDGWILRTGAVGISGHSHRGRQVEDRAVMSMAPSARGPCRRIRSRCTVLADGRVTLCDQDINGRHAVGRIGPDSFEHLWRGAAFQDVRDAHGAGRFDITPLCAACEEWQRP